MRCVTIRCLSCRWEWSKQSLVRAGFKLYTSFMCHHAHMIKFFMCLPFWCEESRPSLVTANFNLSTSSMYHFVYGQSPCLSARCLSCSLSGWGLSCFLWPCSLFVLFGWGGLCLLCLYVIKISILNVFGTEMFNTKCFHYGFLSVLNSCDRCIASTFQLFY